MNLSNIVFGDNFTEENVDNYIDKTDNEQSSTSEHKEYEDDFMLSNQLNEEDEDPKSFKRPLEISDTLKGDENVFEALPSHFKRPRVENDKPKFLVEESVCSF
ncbi:hypothetical protein AVEN_73735-1 [Araneus ventricosus]|uniref:Uncharacterized protein n=1 Tax=Araneus ventricosus TaxID=182803 RepID=A0A4Y2N7J5_ARAVE|nr:hypothetical protein AVEN_73735-1 [Araneus ventricosus]